MRFSFVLQTDTHPKTSLERPFFYFVGYKLQIWSYLELNFVWSSLPPPLSIISLMIVLRLQGWLHQILSLTMVFFCIQYDVLQNQMNYFSAITIVRFPTEYGVKIWWLNTFYLTVCLVSAQKILEYIVLHDKVKILSYCAWPGVDKICQSHLYINKLISRLIF